ILKSNTRKGDITARYGGEEFIVLLPETSEKHAVGIAEKIRIEIEKCEVLLKSVEKVKKAAYPFKN
ncbi:MAG: diguanylate cyclase, partial [Nitrospinota bacterium]|nr:diguanylate cyclase [Nitrospinota bacterium]